MREVPLAMGCRGPAYSAACTVELCLGSWKGSRPQALVDLSRMQAQREVGGGMEGLTCAQGQTLDPAERQQGC